MIDATDDGRLIVAITEFADSASDPALAGQLERLFLSGPPAFRRDFFDDGHLTGSAWLTSSDGERVLLTLHRKLGRWLQLGGHADGDSDLAAVALREATEESGLADLTVERAIFDLDRHLIPAHRSEPAHYHYDVRFIVHARGDERFTISDESIDLRWWPIAEVIRSDAVDPSLKRMADKWLEIRGKTP